MIDAFIKIIAIIIIVFFLIVTGIIIQSEGYKEGYKAGTTSAMQRIQDFYGITNIDSSISKAKRMRSDSLSIIIFNTCATEEERALVKSFALWLKRIKEVK